MSTLPTKIFVGIATYEAAHVLLNSLFMMETHLRKRISDVSCELGDPSDYYGHNYVEELRITEEITHDIREKLF